MADIEVLEQWDEGVYQLETTDPVQGGADGVDNKPHKNLANRTLWLKNNKADKNGNLANKFAVADGTGAKDAVNKSQLDTKAALAGLSTQPFKVANGTLNDEAVNLGQLNTKINILDIQDVLNSIDTTKPLSANQGRILKGFIDNIMAILNSDDTTLDELQEIVNFIKQNKATLDALTISNIAGLFEALNNKADKNGNAENKFKVASATDIDEAVSLSQANNLIISQKGRLGTQQGTLNSSFTLSSGYVGKLLVCAGGITITLPAINTIASGDLFIIRNDGIDEINISLNGNSTTLGLNTITGGETIILQSDGGSLYREISRTSKIPAYEDLATTMAYNTVHRANTDITVNVRCTGNFMNGIQLVVGKTTTPTRVIHRFGDDINSNTKWISFQAVIPAGMYWKVEGYGSHGFETVEIIEYKHK